MNKTKYDILNELSTNPIKLSLKIFKTGLINKNGVELYNLLLNIIEQY